MTNTVGHRIQWHPPFFTALQLELDLENLDFKDEYCVRKLPCRMDVLVTKHDKKLQINKNISQIFSSRIALCMSMKNTEMTEDTKN